ncbi:hypothetical protein [Methanobrevibacter arboriphilus]|uniref:Uncharacterized protein n=1 Tax=Methanobrevibacter arboriphilus TaxID=39441 RepID=A0ACA8R528_METAZ|nr:hypothetical protein [Methanobrevibacter arboriphilus]BBL62638.1 hypothetical protein MarbSA_16780 [Methanobrevibacter arboriphilus]
MFKKISKGESADFDGYLLDVKQLKKIQKDLRILDKIEEIVRKQNNVFFIDKNN